MSRLSSDPVVTRLQEVSPRGFQVRLQEEEGARDGGKHCAETVGWIALQPGPAPGEGRSIEAILTSPSVTDQPYALSFSRAFAAVPALLASMQTFEGKDTAGLRWTTVTTKEAEVFVNEETSADEETTHAPEVVGCVALEAGPVVACIPVETDTPAERGNAVAGIPAPRRSEIHD
jgi:hypothetical protein